ncbi:MAG: histidine phosphatase family protein [Pseudomonadota bacterium]
MRILLLRHAKSSWDHRGLIDHDRPLAPRGERAATAMGAHAAAGSLRVDRVVSSTALRAQSTARRFLSAFNSTIPMTTRHDLYHAGAMVLLAIAIHEAGGDDDARIMLVGHNPGMHELACGLATAGEPIELARLQTKFPTGALAEFDLPDSPGLSGSQGSRLPFGQLKRLVRPKDLPVAQEFRF